MSERSGDDVDPGLPPTPALVAESAVGDTTDDAAEWPRCSAKRCRAAAIVDLEWRNPRLHDAARRKHWVACAEHEEQLADFLARRGFLLGRGPLRRS